MKQKNNGFTFLEVIIASFLFASIVGGAAIFSVYFFQNNSFSFEEQQQEGEAQAALTKMIREIRKTQAGQDGSWPLIQTDDTTLSFYADVNGDGSADKVRYFMNGTNLQRGIIFPTTGATMYPAQNEIISTIVSNINATSSAVFQYYNENWPSDQVNNPLVASARILNTRFIQVNLNINTSQNFAAAPFTLSSSVALRNLKDNL